MGDGLEGTSLNNYDALNITLDAYRQEIEKMIPELAPYVDAGGQTRSRVLVDYPDQNVVKVNPPQLTIMDSLSVIRHKIGGTRKVSRALNPDGKTWRQVSRVGFGRIIFQMDLWAENATQRGKIHAALMGLMSPKWTLKVGDDAIAVLVLQHYRPVRDGRENSVARSLYQGYILTPELVAETLYNVEEINVGLGFLTGKGPEPPATTKPRVNFYELPDE